MSLYTGYRHTRFAPRADRAVVWGAIAEYLQRYVPGDGSVLDLGSGYCDFINAIQAARRWAVDLHIDPAEFAASGVTCLRTDVTDLGAIPDDALDLVLASNLLEHLTDEQIALTLRGVRAKLRPGGRFIALQPNFAYCHRTYFDDYTHVRIFTHVSLPDFLAAQGFAIERVTPRFLPFSMRSRFPKWRFLVRAYLRSPLRPFASQMLVVARKA